MSGTSALTINKLEIPFDSFDMLHLPKSKLTVLVHFFNEEFLLPQWLSHHTKLFDHGIMVDYSSTDRSIEIIKEMAPTWEIVQSKNEWFDAEAIDAEMMDYEETVTGWKMVLNVTEFLFVSNLRSRLNTKEDMLRFKGYQINDTEEEKEAGFDNSCPLILQRFNGCIDPWRHRIIHRRPNGGYYVGRHYETPGLKRNPLVKQHHGKIPFGDGLYLLWYRFAPYNEQIPRKLQISERIPQSSIDKGFGWNHWHLTEEKIEKRWREQLPHCRDIREDSAIMQEYLQLTQGTPV